MNVHRHAMGRNVRLVKCIGNHSIFAFMIACSLACGCLPSTPQAQNDDKSRPMSGKSLENWKNVFQEMKSVLALDDGEQKRLRDTFEKHVSSLQDWYTKHSQKVADADAEALRSFETKDLNRLRQLKAEITPLKKEVLRLHKDMDEAVLGALEESKRHQWLGYRIASRLLQLCEPIKLSKDQRQQILQLGTQSAEYVKARSVPQAAGLIELEKRVESQVFTPHQVASYDEIKDKNKLRSLKTLSSYQNTDGSFR